MKPTPSHIAIIVALACVGASAQSMPAGDALWDQATIYRDEWGTPHVYADTARALAFAFGYAQAEDHLEGMLKAYRVANGCAAEVYGPDYEASDRFSLMMAHGELAAHAIEETDAVTRDLCEGFAEGVNAYIVSLGPLAPEWADGVRPADVLALLHCYLMSQAPFDAPDLWRPGPATPSANAWAVGPPASSTGEPMLVINPHTYYEGPFQWYEAHLVCGDMNVTGATLFGLPVILQGHNEVLGWALTPNDVDIADVYAEPIFEMSRDPKSLMPKIDGDVVEFAERVLTTRNYFVKTPTGLEMREARAQRGDNGPVLDLFGNNQYTYKVGGYYDFGALRQFVEMARARDLITFQEALALHQLPCFQVIYADSFGNIFYLYNAKVGDKYVPRPPPLEPETGRPLATPEDPVNWAAPLDARDSRTRWGPIVSVAGLPMVTNPSSGYLQACGSPPWAATLGLDMLPEDWPAWFARDTDTFRSGRVRRLLATGPRSFQDMQAMLYDVVAPFAVEAVPRLLSVAERSQALIADAHPDLSAGLDLLRRWNCVADVNSPGMTFFHLWWGALRGQSRYAIEPNLIFLRALEESPETQEEALRAAAGAAMLLRNEYQRLDVPWGDVHKLRRGGIEAAMPGAMNGDPIFIAEDRYHDGRGWPMTYGYGFAMAVKFGEGPEAVSVLPFGSSENPQSPHYADQLELFRERRFKKAWFELEDVERHTALAHGRIMTLRPMGIEGRIRLSADKTIDARLSVATHAPAPLPEDLAPFTLFVAPDYAPEEASVEAVMEFYIPEALCATEDLPRLAVHVNDEKAGWLPLAQQQCDLATRLIRASDSRARAYVVLGPRECFIEAPTPEAADLESPSRDESAPQIPKPAAPEPSVPEQVDDASPQYLPSPLVPARGLPPVGGEEGLIQEEDRDGSQ